MPDCWVKVGWRVWAVEQHERRVNIVAPGHLGGDQFVHGDPQVGVREEPGFQAEPRFALQAYPPVSHVGEKFVSIVDQLCSTGYRRAAGRFEVIEVVRVIYVGPCRDGTRK